MSDLDLDFIQPQDFHDWDCDRFRTYDHGLRQGTCDCGAAVAVSALVAALREARAEVDRLRETMALAESVFMAEARASGQYEAERDDWRRRYDALSDGVTGLHFRDARGGCASCVDPDGFSVWWPCETAAVVARVEGDES